MMWAWAGCPMRVECSDIKVDSRVLGHIGNEMVIGRPIRYGGGVWGG